MRGTEAAKRVYPHKMPRLKPVLRAARDIVYRIAYWGAGRWCPVCEKPARRFRPFGVEWKREQAMCVHCGFEVQVVRDTDVADSREIDVMGLSGAGEVFLATRLFNQVA